jgi:hypothetical protein
MMNWDQLLWNPNVNKKMLREGPGTTKALFLCEVESRIKHVELAKIGGQGTFPCHQSTKGLNGVLVCV